MSEVNHYEPPKSELAAPPHSKLDTRLLAARMLEIRRRGGFSIGLFLRWNRRRYFFVLAYFVVILGLLAAIGIWEPFFLILGVFVCFFARDFGWLKATQKSWPFTDRVTNWDLVRKLADE